MAAPDLKKAGLTAASEVAKSAAELIALSQKWRKARDEFTRASTALRDNPPKDAKKLQELDKKMDALKDKHRDATLADNKKWKPIHVKADELMNELPERIALLRQHQARFQLVVDTAVRGLKDAAKKPAGERQKAVLDCLKKAGLM